MRGWEQGAENGLRDAQMGWQLHQGTPYSNMVSPGCTDHSGGMIEMNELVFFARLFLGTVFLPTVIPKLPAMSAADP